MVEDNATPASQQRESRSLARVRRRWMFAVGLAASDIVLINVAFVLAYGLRYKLQLLWAIDPAYMVPYSVFIPFALVLTGLLLILYRRDGLYDLRPNVSWFDEVLAIINGTSTGIVIMVVLVFISRPSFYSRIIFFYGGTIIVLLLSASRLVKAMILRDMRRKGIGVARAIIVGAGEVGRAVMRSIVAQPELGLQILGFVDDDPEKGSTDIGRFKALGGLDRMDVLIQDGVVDQVIITLPWQYYRKIMAIMSLCQRENVQVRIVPDLFQMTLGQMTVTTIAGIPLIGTKPVIHSDLSRLAKRGSDVVFSALVLVLALPLMALTAIVIKLDSAGPVFFRQQRVGRGGRRFELFKFRSMAVDADSRLSELTELNEADGPVFKMRDDPRCTPVGRLIRRLSIDELPQFINVLRGDMSVIGPRPALPEEVEKYKPWHRRRLEAKPGITGLWQVSGRSDLPFDEMVLLDIFYAEQWSPSLDFKILLRTIPAVLFVRGAY